MNPQLSRSVGTIMMADAVHALPMERVDRHSTFVDEVSRADSCDVLLAWVREVTLEGERQLAAFQGATLPGLMTDPDRRCRLTALVAKGTTHDVSILSTATGQEKRGRHKVG
jgi:hypothetical protein